MVRPNPPLKDVIVAAITPRRPGHHSIDLDAALDLIDFLATSGAQAIALLTSAGEFVHFSIEDRRQFVKLAAKRSRLPLLVNVSHSTLDGAVELAWEAALSGVAGLLLMPPYFFHHSQESIRSFYLTFAAAIGHAAPVYLASELAPATAAELLATGRFAGVLESNLDTLRVPAPFTLLASQERTYVEAKALGAHGLVSSVACAVPELVVALDQAIQAQAQDRVARLHQRTIELLDRIEALPPLAAIQEAVRQRQLRAGPCAVPLGKEDERRLAEFREWLRAWLPQALRECP